MMAQQLPRFEHFFLSSVRCVATRAPHPRLAAVLLLLSNASVAQPTGVWPQRGFNAQHTGRSPYVGTAVGAFKWNFTTGNGVRSSPAIGSDGTVYVGSDDHLVYAFNGSTGAIKWSYTTGDIVGSSPTIDADGTVYAGSYDHQVYAFNGTTGARKWIHVMASSVDSPAAIGADGTVYVGADDNNVYALNGTTGAPKWSYLTGGYVSSSPAIGTDGTVYVGSYDHMVYALNGTTGLLKWSYRTGDTVTSSPAIGADGTVYVGSQDAKVYALNTSGALKWSYLTGNIIWSSPAIGVDGTVYIGSLDNLLYALNGTTGALIWNFSTGDGVYSSPAIGADGMVYVGSNDHLVYALNGTTGILVWSYATGGYVQSSPAIGADGTIYVGSVDGNLYALGKAAGNNPSPPDVGTIVTIVGTGVAGWNGDGIPATAAHINTPYFVATDIEGNIFVSDFYNSRIRKIIPNGTISTFAGNGTTGHYGNDVDDVAATSSELAWPNGVSCDKNGSVYVADPANERIRRVFPNGSITTIAGTGVEGYGSDNLPATSSALNNPWGVTVDDSGVVLIADTVGCVIRRMGANGILSIVAGMLGSWSFGGDNGAATSAQMFFPYQVIVDFSGNWLIVDGNNNRIRRVSVSDGVISTIAGSGKAGFNGDGIPATLAQLNGPLSIAVDGNGTLFIADTANHRIRKVVNGTISTIAGNGTAGYNGDGISPTSAMLNFPRGIALDSFGGNLLIADTNNNRVRKMAVGAASSRPSIDASSTRTLAVSFTATLSATSASSETASHSASATMHFSASATVSTTATPSSTPSSSHVSASVSPTPTTPCTSTSSLTLSCSPTASLTRSPLPTATPQGVIRINAVGLDGGSASSAISYGAPLLVSEAWPPSSLVVSVQLPLAPPSVTPSCSAGSYFDVGPTQLLVMVATPPPTVLAFDATTTTIVNTTFLVTAVFNGAASTASTESAWVTCNIAAGGQVWTATLGVTVLRTRWPLLQDAVVHLPGGLLTSVWAASPLNATAAVLGPCLNVSDSSVASGGAGDALSWTDAALRNGTVVACALAALAAELSLSSHSISSSGAFGLTLSGATRLTLVADAKSWYTSDPSSDALLRGDAAWPGLHPFDASSVVYIGGTACTVEWISPDGFLMQIVTPSEEVLCPDLASQPCGYHSLTIVQPVANAFSPDALQLVAGSPGYSSSPSSLSVSCPPLCPSLFPGSAPAIPPPSSTMISSGGASAASLSVLPAYVSGGDGANATLTWVPTSALQAATSSVGIYYVNYCVGFLDPSTSSICVNASDPRSATECAYGSGDCELCPAGGLCPGGFRVWSRVGWYQAQASVGIPFPCVAPSTLRCIGWNASTGTTQCGVGYRQGSIGCESCDEGYFSATTGAPCTQCETAHTISLFVNLLAFVAALTGLAALNYALICLALKLGGGTAKGGAWRSLQFLVWVFTLVQLVAQVGRASLHSTDLPSFILHFYAALEVFQFSGLLPPAACVGGYPFRSEAAQMGLVLGLETLVLVLLSAPHVYCLMASRGAVTRSPRMRLLGGVSSLPLPVGAAAGEVGVASPSSVGSQRPFTLLSNPMQRRPATHEVNSTTSVAVSATELSPESAHLVAIPSHPRHSMAALVPTFQLGAQQQASREEGQTHGNPHPAASTASSSVATSRESTSMDGICGHTQRLSLLSLTTYASVVLLTLLYPLVMSTAMQMVYCVEQSVSVLNYLAMDNDGSAMVRASRSSVEYDEQLSVQTLASDSHFVCYEARHRPVGILAWITLCLYVTGYPLATLMWTRRRIRAATALLEQRARTARYLSRTGKDSAAVGSDPQELLPPVSPLPLAQPAASSSAPKRRTSRSVPALPVTDSDPGLVVDESGALGPQRFCRCAANACSLPCSPICARGCHAGVSRARDQDDRRLFDVAPELATHAVLAQFASTDYSPHLFFFHHIDMSCLLLLSVILVYWPNPDSIGEAVAKLFVMLLILGGMLVTFGRWLPFRADRAWKLYVKLGSFVVAAFAALLNYLLDAQQLRMEYAAENSGSALHGAIVGFSYMVFGLCVMLFLVLVVAFWSALLRGARWEERVARVRAEQLSASAQLERFRVRGGAGDAVSLVIADPPAATPTSLRDTGTERRAALPPISETLRAVCEHDNYGIIASAGERGTARTILMRTDNDRALNTAAFGTQSSRVRRAVASVPRV